MLGGIEGRRRRGRQRMRYLDDITDSMDMVLGELRLAAEAKSENPPATLWDRLQKTET